MNTHEPPKILVVNDDAAGLMAMTSLLEQWAALDNYRVVAVRSGHDALREVLRHDFAVILLDVNMPGMDGFETAEAIHQRVRSADIPIIFVTAFLADELDRLKAYQRGAADFLFTPVIPQVLRAKVSVFVALATKNEELKQQAAKLSASNRRLVREIEERKSAERKSHAKDEFLAMLGHELRNPLSAISSAAALASLAGASADTVQRACQIVSRQSAHLARIVDDLLDLSRAMSGKVLLTRAPLELRQLVERCVDTFAASGRAAAHQISLQLQPCWINADPTRLEQVVSNLLDNALKYTPAGGHISLRTATEGEQAILTVQDAGGGIAPELMPHIFDVFVQGSSTLERAQGGLGIGLALVRRLVELHGGTIRAISAGSDAGSTFEVRLPCCAAPAAPAEAARPCGAGRPSVLLIEDNDDGRDMMATMLSACGYDIAHAADGIAGVELATSSPPDVALVDIGLPGIDGYEVARRLRACNLTRRIKLIALTGYGLEDDRRRVLDAGFDLHLVKPVDMDNLLAAIGDCMPH
ncbi:MAG: response regulator [Pseudomonadota bacterium]